MTTRIQIINPRDNKHSVNIFKAGEYIAQIPPGDCHVCHIWEDAELVIQEVPNKLKEKKIYPLTGNIEEQESY